MKTKFLASTAIAVIGLAGAAWAQQTAPAAKAEPRAETAAAEMPMVGEKAGAPAADVATETASERMRSYSSNTTTEPFTASLAGGISADDLIGMSVVDSDGESVGKVAYLIIGQDDLVQHAIVAVGGFFGFGAKTTAIGFEHATVDQSKSKITLDITRAEIDAMSAYQRGDNGWFSG